MKNYIFKSSTLNNLKDYSIACIEISSCRNFEVVCM